MYIPSAGSPWGPPRRDSCPRVRNASERTDEEDDVVSQALGGSPILDATGAPSLCDWSTIGIQKALKYAKPNVGGSGAYMRRFDDVAELAAAAGAGELDVLFGIDGSAILQEYHPPREGSIVRVEALDNTFLYAIRIWNDPNEGFNLCPADICQAPEVDLDFCPADAPAKPGRRIEAESPPDRLVQAVLRVFQAAEIDVGGVEFLESERDGQVYFYDINALSNFVTDAPNVVGFDPFVRFVDFLERRWTQAGALDEHAARSQSR